MSALETQQADRKLNLTDRAFQGLPIPGVKKSVEDLTSNRGVKDALDKIMSGELNFASPSKKGRYIDTSAGYYVYTIKLSDNSDIDVIFYSRTNEKVLVRIGNEFEEVEVHTDKRLLNKILTIYPTLPIYTKDATHHTRLLAV